MPGKEFVAHQTIKEFHLDTFGHVNNAVYLTILEGARWDLITDNGYSLEVVKKTGLGPVILSLSLDFKRELRLRDKIKILTRCLDYKGRIGHLLQEIYNENGELCAKAMFTFALFDTQKRKIVAPTPEWLSAIGMEPPN